MSSSTERCIQHRIRILELSQKVTAIHIGGSFSAIEIIDAIYNECKRPNDIFLLSKGHAGVALYVVLESVGLIKSLELDTYTRRESIFGVHPTKKISGIISGFGSLGHGLGVACGIAYHKKYSKDSTQDKVFVLMSDGELQEGSTWEALLVASNLKLDNLVILIDLNDFQSFGRMSDNHPAMYPVRDKFEAFGAHCIEVDGHNTNEILKALNQSVPGKCSVIVCNTIKGKGVSEFENNPIWHYRSPDSDEYKLAVSELLKS